MALFGQAVYPTHGAISDQRGQGRCLGGMDYVSQSFSALGLQYASQSLEGQSIRHPCFPFGRWWDSNKADAAAAGPDQVFRVCLDQVRILLESTEACAERITHAYLTRSRTLFGHLLEQTRLDHPHKHVFSGGNVNTGACA